MHPGINGPKFKDKPALIMAGSGDVITHQELNELSNQGAQLFRSLGLKPGDSLAFMMENHKLFFPIAFAAYRSGLKYTAISWRLQASEVEYIVKDCGASAAAAGASFVYYGKHRAVLITYPSEDERGNL